MYGNKKANDHKSIKHQAWKRMRRHLGAEADKTVSVARTEQKEILDNRSSDHNHEIGAEFRMLGMPSLLRIEQTA